MEQVDKDYLDSFTYAMSVLNSKSKTGKELDTMKYGQDEKQGQKARCCLGDVEEVNPFDESLSAKATHLGQESKAKASSKASTLSIGIELVGVEKVKKELAEINEMMNPKEMIFSKIYEVIGIVGDRVASDNSSVDDRNFILEVINSVLYEERISRENTSKCDFDLAKEIYEGM